MTTGIILLLIALGFIFGPWMAATQMPVSVRMVFMVVGALIGIVGGLVILITKLYVKASADKAFVRTGMGGPAVVLDGGCVAIPVVHEIVDVSLNTLKLVVNRVGNDALITGDKLRGDVDAEFYIRVQADPDDILQAARSLGMRSLDTRSVTELVGEKLVSALRSIAAKAPLDELNTNREQFAADVAAAVREDLRQNGLTLEAVTISSLDQTPVEHLKEDNVFDAEGRRRIAEVTSENAITENVANRTADREIAEENAQTREQVAQREFREARADADRDADIRQAKAEADREAAVYEAEREWETRQAQLTTDQHVGQRDAERDREIRIAHVNANQVAEVAEVERKKTVEIADRQREIAIADAESQRAEAQAEQLRKEQARETEDQEVITVEQVAGADREKRVKVIAAEQSAAVRKEQEFANADIKAYEAATVARGDREAAQEHAEAIRMEAQANKDARTLEADGEQAIEMVPVNVDNSRVNVDVRRQTEVEQARVDVLKQELEAKDIHERVAVELEKFLELMGSVQSIGVEQAKAVGQGLSEANMTLFGDPDLFNRFASNFGAGAGVSGLFQGIFGSDGDDNVLGNVLRSVVGGLSEGDLRERVTDAAHAAATSLEREPEREEGAGPANEAPPGDEAESSREQTEGPEA